MAESLLERGKKTATQKRAALLLKLGTVGYSAADFELEKAETLALCRAVDDLTRQAPGAQARVERLLAKVEPTAGGPLTAAVRRAFESAEQASARAAAEILKLDLAEAELLKAAATAAEESAIRARFARAKEEARTLMFKAATSPSKARITAPGQI